MLSGERCLRYSVTENKLIKVLPHERLHEICLEENAGSIIKNNSPVLEYGRL